jgi:hypothetical protein
MADRPTADGRQGRAVQAASLARDRAGAAGADIRAVACDVSSLAAPHGVEAVFATHVL